MVAAATAAPVLPCLEQDAIGLCEARYPKLPAWRPQCEKNQREAIADLREELASIIDPTDDPAYMAMLAECLLNTRGEGNYVDAPRLLGCYAGGFLELAAEGAAF